MHPGLFLPQRRCPRRGSSAVTCALLSLAVLAAGVTLKAAAAPAPEPKKEEPAQVDPKAEPPDAPDVPLLNLDDLLKNLPRNGNLDQAAVVREQMRKIQEMQRRLGQAGLGGPAFPGLPGGPGNQPQEGRLGVVVEKPGDTLIDQLELPRDQGLILREVAPDSAADKAGLKAHDILLEVDGKPVSSDPAELRKTLEGVKADTPVDVVVLRKGKKETVKGLSLPEAKAAAPVLPGFNPAVPLFPANFPNLGQGDGPGAINRVVSVNNGVMTTMSRSNDQFTARRLEPGMILTVKGKVEDGKAKVGAVVVQEGAELNTYDSVDKVPEKVRDKVKELVDMSEKGAVKSEIKAP